jgi:hypothetical protein
MREIFTYGSVGGALGNRRFYPDVGQIFRFAPNLPQSAALTSGNDNHAKEIKSFSTISCPIT